MQPAPVTIERRCAKRVRRREHHFIGQPPRAVRLTAADDRLPAATATNSTPQGSAMHETRFAARTKQRDFHWAWYLAPLGPVAIVLLGLVLVMTPGERPAPTFAANQTPSAAKTAVGPALAAKPVQGRPAPAARTEAEMKEQPSKF